MRGLARALTVAWAIASASPAAGEARAPRIAATAELLPDGTELVHLPVPGARRGSLRYVVRAGTAFDPPNKAGLAHLVEHAIMTMRAGPERLIDEVSAAGGVLNAFTSRDATWYSLDAPADRFPELARKLLAAVTDPRFETFEAADVQGVVDSEDEQVSDGGGYLGVAATAIFPVPVGAAIGTALTRDRVTRDDILEFYRARYLTIASTVVIAGAVTLEDARALVEDGSALPPALPTERYAPRRSSPSLPTEQEVRAPFHTVVVGYRVDEADWAACRSAAELVNVRLFFLYQLRRPVLPWAEVDCHRLRGVPFLFTAAYARSLEEESLPEIIDAAYANAVERPMDEAERRILTQRRARLLDRHRDSPDDLADAAAALAAEPRDGGLTPLAALERPMLSPAALRDFAKRTFVRERRVNLTFTPY